MHRVFVPSVEANVGQNVFLPDDPWKILTSGKIADVPMIIGITEKEIGFASSCNIYLIYIINYVEYSFLLTYIFLFFFVVLIPMITVMKDPLVKIIPAALNATDEAQTKPITTVLNKYYFNNMPVFMNPTGISNVMKLLLFQLRILLY